MKAMTPSPRQRTMPPMKDAASKCLPLSSPADGLLGTPEVDPVVGVAVAIVPVVGVSFVVVVVSAPAVVVSVPSVETVKFVVVSGSVVIDPFVVVPVVSFTVVVVVA